MVNLSLFKFTQRNTSPSRPRNMNFSATRRLSSVTNMYSMFSGASAFNGNLSTWCGFYPHHVLSVKSGCKLEKN